LRRGVEPGTLPYVAETLSDPVERRRIRVRGVVQGVGFRPFVHRLATGSRLTGFVLNDGEGVVVEVEGPGPLLDSFAEALVHEAPTLARVDLVTSERIASVGERVRRRRQSRCGPLGARAPGRRDLRRLPA
jgi:hydrogenase maturation protein HypF